jgi:hypothetical protein
MPAFWHFRRPERPLCPPRRRIRRHHRGRRATGLHQAMYVIPALSLVLAAVL